MNSHQRKKYRRQLERAGKAVPGWLKPRDLGLAELKEKVVAADMQMLETLNPTGLDLFPAPDQAMVERALADAEAGRGSSIDEILGNQTNTGDFFMPGEITKVYAPGTVWKLNTDKYGKSYAGRKVTVVESPKGDAIETVIVQLPKRKSPLVVFVSELEAVRE